MVKKVKKKMTLADFVPTKKKVSQPRTLLRVQSPSSPRVQIPQQNFINPYWYSNRMIGYMSPDKKVFKLVRKTKNFTTRKFPDHTQISRDVIIDLIYRKKCRKILIEVDGEIKYWTTPLTWKTRGFVDRLTPEQEPQIFLALKFIHKVVK